LEQGAALPHRPGARLVGLGSGVGADALLIGLVGVPVDEPRMMIFNENLPLALGQLAAADSQHTVVAEVALLAGLWRTHTRPRRRDG
jgi:hypothetical protein